MMSDIFSSFDPYVFNTYLPSINLLLCLSAFILTMTKGVYWGKFLRAGSATVPLYSLILSQLSRTFMTHIKGLSGITATVFFMVIAANLIGLVPYMFSLSSHLIFTLSFGLPLWMSMMLSTFTKAPKASTAHFLPDGAPDWLNPFLVLIETSSIMVRPMTLSFRLAANMSAGHIVLSLIGVYCSAAIFSSYTASMLLLLTTVGYILFEVAICLIQAYIFCLLLSLYADDHAH